MIIKFRLWWGRLGSNQRPIGYEPTALTPELRPRETYYSASEVIIEVFRRQFAQCGVDASSSLVILCRTARANSAVISLACGPTIVPPTTICFLSTINFTKPIRWSVILLRTVVVSGTIAIFALIPFILQSYSLIPI